MNLGDFKSLLRRSHKRGSALDNDLDGAIRRAARWIEANHTLHYMKQRFQVTVTQGTDEVELPKIGIKAILSLRYRELINRRIVHLSKTTLEAVHPVDDLPSEFYLDGAYTIVFNGSFQEDFELIGRMSRYSDWPKKETDTHWLLDNAESLMLTQTMLELGLISRDERSYGMFMQNRDQQIRTLINADYEAEYAGQDIAFGPDQ